MYPISNSNHNPWTSPALHQPTASTSSGVTQSSQYIVRSKSFAELSGNRERLKASGNGAARILGAELEKVHTQVISGEISKEQHLAECHNIREAAEMISGFIDVEDEVLAKFKLQDKDNRTLATAEYLAILDDLGCQIDTDVLSNRERSEAARNASARGRANLQHMNNRIEALLVQMPEFRLIPRLTVYGFSPEQIGSMAAAQAIEAVHEHFDSLTAFRFSRDEIARMSSLGGAQAIAAVVQHFHSLSANWFSGDEIVRMASHPEGAQAIAAVVQHSAGLVACEFSPEQIVLMASRLGGAQEIETAALQMRRGSDEQG